MWRGVQKEVFFWPSKSGYNKALHLLVMVLYYVPYHLSLRMFVKSTLYSCLGFNLLFIAAALKLCDIYCDII